MSPTLHDLLARGTPVEWFEAVAIVQALCRRLLEDPPAAGIRVPNLDEIVLRDDGTVEITGEGPESQSPVFRVGEVFMALVGGRQMPVSLRLLALTVVSPSPPYASIAELTASLDFHERPNRAENVRAVCERHAKLPAIATDAAPAEIPAAPKLPPTEREQRWRWWRRRLAVVGASAALMVALFIVGIWAMRSGGSAWVARSTGDMTQVVRATSNAVANTVSSGIEAVRERFGKGQAPAAAPPPASPVNEPEARPVRLRRPVLRANGGWPPVATIATYTLPTATAGSAESLTGLMAALVETPAAAAPIVEPGEWAIYSGEDLDVVPPVAVHPKLPSEPPPGVRLEELPVLELLVSQSGEVERARLRGPRPDVRASMMVSAAKAWRFDPATRGGKPVRYRLSVPLTSQ